MDELKELMAKLIAFFLAGWSISMGILTALHIFKVV